MSGLDAGLAEIFAIRARRYQLQNQSKLDIFTGEAKVRMGSHLFYAVKDTVRWIRALVRVQRMARAYLERHAERLMNQRMVMETMDESDGVVRSEQDYEYIKTCSCDLDPKRMRMMAAINSFLKYLAHQNLTVSYEDIWKTYVSSIEELKKNLRYVEEMVLRRVWVLSNPTVEMVKLIGTNVLQYEREVWIKKALRICKVKIESPVEQRQNMQQTQEVFCVGCGNPGFFKIGDVDVCRNCFEQFGGMTDI